MVVARTGAAARRRTEMVKKRFMKTPRLIRGMPCEALTPLPLSPKGREGQRRIIVLLFSLLSPRERRAGEVRASKGIPFPHRFHLTLDDVVSGWRAASAISSFGMPARNSV